MKVGLLVLLFVGLMLMTANAAIKQPSTAAPGKVEYKYLPRDLDDYLREDTNQPSILYKSMFTDEDVVR